MDEKQKVAQLKKTVIIIAGLLASSVVYLAFIAHSIVSAAENKRTLQEAIDAPVLRAFAFASICAAFMSFFMKKKLSPPSLPKGIQGDQTVERMQSYFRGFLLSYVFSECVGTFGFVLATTTKNFEIAIPFFCVSAALLIVHFPRPDRW